MIASNTAAPLGRAIRAGRPPTIPGDRTRVAGDRTVYRPTLMARVVSWATCREAIAVLVEGERHDAVRAVKRFLPCAAAASAGAQPRGRACGGGTRGCARRHCAGCTDAQQVRACACACAGVGGERGHLHPITVEEVDVDVKHTRVKFEQFLRRAARLASDRAAVRCVAPTVC